MGPRSGRASARRSRPPIAPAELPFADGDIVTLSLRSAECFQNEFQGERAGGDRLVSDGADDPLVAGRRADDGRRLVCEVVAADGA